MQLRFIGYLDDFQLFSDSLTPQQIINLYYGLDFNQNRKKNQNFILFFVLNFCFPFCFEKNFQI